MRFLLIEIHRIQTGNKMQTPMQTRLATAFCNSHWKEAVSLWRGKESPLNASVWDSTRGRAMNTQRAPNAHSDSLTTND